jgi:hypothetical protein
MNNNQNNNPEVKITKHYSFLAFCKQYGKPVVFDDLVNRETGEQFIVVKFEKDGSTTEAFMGKSVRDFNYDDIVKSINELEVGEADNGKNYIYKRKQGKLINIDGFLND